MLSMVIGINFNPRSPCGERRAFAMRKAKAFIFQSTLPMRGATMNSSMAFCRAVFQSTLPMRGATKAGKSTGVIRPNFNPRSPCGERLRRGAVRQAAVYFNPRSPCGERRRVYPVNTTKVNFNPRSPCGERRRAIRKRGPRQDFNPRSPCGERQNRG